MAGEGSRFQAAGYVFPKPFIDVDGLPMIARIIKNLEFPEANFIFLARRAHIKNYALAELLSRYIPQNKITIIPVDAKTEGAACTALLAEDLINSEEDLLIANSDQIVNASFDNFKYLIHMARDLDGAIFCFKNTHPKWSYVKLNSSGLITEVREKKPISDIATTGIYYWKRGSDFVRSAHQMIEQDDRFNNEFYIAPTYNYMIKDEKKIIPFYVDKMWGLGTPEDLDLYLRSSK